MIIISKYSGKADFCIHLWIGAETEEEAFNKFNGTKLYISQPLPDDFDILKALGDDVNIPETYYKKVEYTSFKDLIPYYPYIIAFAACNNKDSHNSIVVLSMESHVDCEEKEILEWYMRDLQKIYRRCKRKKIEFDVEEAVKEVSWHSNIDVIRELAQRVKQYGKKATTEGIHLPFYEKYYRQELVDEMLKHGINPCEYGDYERFVRGNLNESIKK